MRHDAPGELVEIRLRADRGRCAVGACDASRINTEFHFQSFLKLAIGLLLLKPCPLAFPDPEVVEPEYIRSCAYILYESRGDCCCIAAKESAEDGEGQIPKLLEELEEAEEGG